MEENSLMSVRSKAQPVDIEYINTYSVNPALKDSYDEDSNPNGIINFGTAVNGQMDDVWLERFSTNHQFFQADSKHYRYYQFWGPDTFRKDLATFLTRFFKPKLALDFNNLFVLNGALTSLDILSSLLADEGDVFLCPTPCYSGYFQAGVKRWGVRMTSVPMVHNEKTGEMFELTIESLEKAVSDEESKGKNVRALVFNNPHNPLGKVFNSNRVKDIMRFCQRRGIHLIADEMYCMSVFDQNSHFQSVFQLHEDELLDPNRLHVIWGFSKDLCLTGFRTGIIHTKNKDLQLALMINSQFQAVPLPVMNILGNVISDIDWFENVFVPLNHDRMKAAYEKAKNVLASLDIRTTTTSAGFFFLVDFRPLFNPPNEANEKAFIRKLYAHRLYITPSWEIHAESGWFRFVFTPYIGKGLETGLERMKTAIEEWRNEQNTHFSLTKMSLN